MRILYFTSSYQDYLSDSILVGLHQLSNQTGYNIEITEYPENKFIYKDSLEHVMNLYGNGFTLYGVVETRRHVYRDGRRGIDISDYDVVVFSDIHGQYGYFIQYFDRLKDKNTIILDGADNPEIYPYSGYYWKRKYLWGIPKAHRRFNYFKRELTPETIRHCYFKLVPGVFSSILLGSSNIKRISFSIPKEKIVTSIPLKTQVFPRHIVDKEIALRISGSSTDYAFGHEDDYYDDLQRSRFGITTRRSGWDCMRHYEIAANGAVICFRDLHLKPESCAPHGLIDGVNCLGYSGYKELFHKVDSLSTEQYNLLQRNCLNWVSSKTCDNMAMYILKEANCIKQ